MPLNGEREYFPIGQLTLDSSALVQADNVSISVDNSLKLEATLADRNGTPVAGMVSVEITWDMKVDQRGPELKMIDAVTEAQPMALGFLFPGGEQRDFKATAAKATITQNLGDLCKVNCTAKGKVVKSAAQ